MNKKFSTLMLGLLLTSAFASAQTVQVAEKLVSGKSYFVVADANKNGAVDDGELYLSATKTPYGVNAVKFEEDNKNLTWTVTESKFETPEGAIYYYSLKNDEVGSYLKFVNGAVVKADKVDGAYLKASDGQYEVEGDVLTVVKGFSASGTELTINENGTVSLSAAGTKILLCEYAKKELSAGAKTAKLFNDVKGGAGFNLKFSSGNSNGWANDILTDLNLKAFYVNVAQWGGSNNNLFKIPEGIYFATEYPASLNNKNVINERTDFEACTFLAVNPDKNYDIHQADRKNGIGFDLTTVSGADLNVYAEQKDDQASVKGEVYVGNACFTIVVPDPLRADNVYNLKLKEVRVQTDASKNAHAKKGNLLIGSILDQNKNYLVTHNETGLSFETTNSSLYDVTKLLKSEDAPSIYTIQFASNTYKLSNYETGKGQYLTVGVDQYGIDPLFANRFLLHSVEQMKDGDPMFQFVVTAIDKDNETVTFTNRQTKHSVVVSLFENEDGTFTVYNTNNADLYVECYDSYVENGNIVFNKGSLQNAKVVLTPVTVEDKFASFVNRADDAGLVTFELAKNIDDAPEFYVGAYRDKEGNLPNISTSLFGYVDAKDLTQFELVKVDADYDDNIDKPFAVENSYVYKKGSRILTSTSKDSVAYYKYLVKAFAEGSNNRNYYLKYDDTYGRFELSYMYDDDAKYDEWAKFIVKENVDGSVSLILNGLANRSFYAEVNSGLHDKYEIDAWNTTNNYYLDTKLNVGLKTFMVEESPAISYEAIPQHVSFEAVRGGFMTKDENSDARLSISTQAAEDLTFWLDTVHADKNIPSFYILKNGAFMYNAADSASYYFSRGNDRFNIDKSNAKLIFKAGELVTSDTLRTVVDGQSVLVAEKDNAPLKIKGGLKNFQFQIIQAETGSDEYIIRNQNVYGVYSYVCLKNNYFYLNGDKDQAYRFVIEKQAAPTANEGIEVSEVKVIAGNGQITIMGAAGKQVVVSNILGKVVASQTITTDNATIAVPAGIVAVAVEGEAAVKAIVK